MSRERSMYVIKGASFCPFLKKKESNVYKKKKQKKTKTQSKQVHTIQRDKPDKAGSNNIKYKNQRNVPKLKHMANRRGNKKLKLKTLKKLSADLLANERACLGRKRKYRRS
jgi:hypothetical protein